MSNIGATRAPANVQGPDGIITSGRENKTDKSLRELIAGLITGYNARQMTYDVPCAARITQRAVRARGRPGPEP
ncbi:MAG: hypothetical protein ACLP22_10075 [Solirubrobacteraceae bacterium]